MAGQLNFAEFKERKTGFNNSLNILQAIKYLRPDSGLGRLFPKRIFRTKLAEGRHALRK